MKNSKKKDSKEPKSYTEKTLKPFPKRYWLVEITSTDGDKLQFYVPAINQHEAYKKADEYAFLAENKELRKIYGNGFKLLP